MALAEGISSERRSLEEVHGSVDGAAGGTGMGSGCGGRLPFWGRRTW